MISVIETIAGRLVAGALLLAGLVAAGAVPEAADRTTPADLRSILDKTDRAIDQAEGAVGGHDPGKVSFSLIRADELLGSFLDASSLEALVKAFDDAHAALRDSDLSAAALAARRASGLMTPLTDFVVLRQAAESSRAAQHAAEIKDTAGFQASLDRLEGSVLAPVLLARVREARAALSRARQAMVHNNMQDGRARVAEVRRAYNGLVLAGALGRATLSLSMGSELLQGGSVITARDQMQKGIRDLKLAVGSDPGDSKDVLQQALDRTIEIWKRSGHARPDDPGLLADSSRAVDGVRMKQPR